MKRALVTGGGDIGGAVCRRLAASGWHVIVHANANLERRRGGRDHAAAAAGGGVDVADGGAAQAAIGRCWKTARSGRGRNAGITTTRRWPECRRVVEARSTSLHGFFHVTARCCCRWRAPAGAGS